MILHRPLRRLLAYSVVILPALATCLALHVSIGCGAAQRVERAVIDCTGGSLPDVTSNILATLDEWGRTEADGGCRTDTGFDWGCVEDRAVAKGEQIGGCALAELVQGTSSPAARVASTPEVNAARATLEDFRSKHARGAVFHTPSGDI
jgi:hypothetical protein